jgi:hypothetical protein
MVAGVFLILGAVALVWGFYHMVQKTNQSSVLRFILPGRQFESGDLWSIAPWVGFLLIVAFALFLGGLPGGGSGTPDPSQTPTSSPTGAPQAQDTPPADAVVHEGTPYFRSYANWYSETGDSCAGDGCKAGAYLAAQRRLTG